MKYRMSSLGITGIFLAFVSLGLLAIWVVEGNMPVGLLAIGIAIMSFDMLHYEVQRHRLYKEQNENKRKSVLNSLNNDIHSKLWFAPDLQSFPVTGKVDKIYFDEETNKIYIWNNIRYVEVIPSAIESLK